MNLKQNPTEAELAAILAQGDDRVCNIAWVGTDGEVHLDPLPDNLTPAGWEESHASELQFRIETFVAGNGYVGPAAAADAVWVAKLFKWLVDTWAAGLTGYIDQ